MKTVLYFGRPHGSTILKVGNVGYQFGTKHRVNSMADNHANQLTSERPDDFMIISDELGRNPVALEFLLSDVMVQPALSIETGHREKLVTAGYIKVANLVLASAEDLADLAKVLEENESFVNRMMKRIKKVTG